jgi:xanthine/uracil permease
MLGVLVGGFIAGTLDITYAIIRQAGRGRSPEWTLQSVATGWLGKASFDGGTGSAALGLVSHYGIAIGAAGVFYLASRFIPFLRERAVLSGLIFGVCVFLFMNWVLIPLSAAPFKIPFNSQVLSEGFASHAILFGVPIALAVRYFSTPRATPANAG